MEYLKSGHSGICHIPREGLWPKTDPLLGLGGGHTCALYWWGVGSMIKAENVLDQLEAAVFVEKETILYCLPIPF